VAAEAVELLASEATLGAASFLMEASWLVFVNVKLSFFQQQLDSDTVGDNHVKTEFVKDFT